MFEMDRVVSVCNYSDTAEAIVPFVLGRVKEKKEITGCDDLFFMI